MQIHLAIDMRDPAAARAFWEGFRLSDAERQAIQARAAADRQFAEQVRTLGKVAAVAARVQRVMQGVAT